MEENGCKGCTQPPHHRGEGVVGGLASCPPLCFSSGSLRCPLFSLPAGPAVGPSFLSDALTRGAPRHGRRRPTGYAVLGSDRDTSLLSHFQNPPKKIDSHPLRGGRHLGMIHGAFPVSPRFVERCVSSSRVSGRTEYPIFSFSIAIRF